MDGTAAQAGSPTSSAPSLAQSDPILVLRPPPKAPRPPSPVTPEGRIHLDVVVDDAGGKPVSGLQPFDFTVLDNNQPRKVLSFRAFNGVTVKPEPPVEVILVVDTANLPFPQVAFVRTELTKFLRQNGGHLAQPVTVMLVSDAGLRVQPRPSADGNALVSILDQIKGSLQSAYAVMGAEADLRRFQKSLHSMADIAENEALKPGRKLLVWVGPGWPILNSDAFLRTEQDQKSYFDEVVELSTKLRQARMAVYSVSPASGMAGATDTTRAILYQDFLKGVKTFRQADSGNLALKVLVTQTGGRILGPGNDLAEQIDTCISDANAFYMLSFNPPVAERPDEYHDLKVQVSQPGLTVRTNSGYYNQPWKVSESELP